MNRSKSETGRGRGNDRIKTGGAGIIVLKEANEEGNLFFRKE